MKLCSSVFTKSWLCKYQEITQMSSNKVKAVLGVCRTLCLISEFLLPDISIHFSTFPLLGANGTLRGKKKERKKSPPKLYFPQLSSSALLISAIKQICLNWHFHMKHNLFGGRNGGEKVNQQSLQWEFGNLAITVTQLYVIWTVQQSTERLLHLTSVKIHFIHFYVWKIPWGIHMECLGGVGGGNVMKTT